MIRSIPRFLKDGRGRISIGPTALLALVAVVVSVSLVATQPWAGGGPTGKVSAQDGEVPWWCEYWAAAFPADCITPTPTDTPTPVDTATPIYTPTPTPKLGTISNTMIGGSAGATNLSADEVQYIPMFYDIKKTTESLVQMPMAVDGIVSHLRIRLGGPPGNGDSYGFVVRKNGANTSVACTVSGASTTCDTSGNKTACVEFSAGDLIAIMSAPSGPPDQQRMWWTAKFTAGASCPTPPKNTATPVPTPTPP